MPARQACGGAFRPWDLAMMREGIPFMFDLWGGGGGAFARLDLGNRNGNSDRLKLKTRYVLGPSSFSWTQRGIGPALIEPAGIRPPYPGKTLRKHAHWRMLLLKRRRHC